jgi:hypothetical protein
VATININLFMKGDYMIIVKNEDGTGNGFGRTDGDKSPNETGNGFGATS